MEETEQGGEDRWMMMDGYQAYHRERERVLRCLVYLERYY